MRYLPRITSVFFICFFVLRGLVLLGAEDMKSNPSVVDNAKKHLREQDKLIERLIFSLRSMLNDKGNDKTRNDEIIDTITLLGQLKAEGAVSLLVKNISFVPKGHTVWERTMDTLYPTIGALVKIGKPATIPLVKEIAACTNKEKLWLYVYTLSRIETLPVARFLLEGKLKSLKNAKEKINLQAALKHPIFKEEKLDAKK